MTSDATARSATALGSLHDLPRVSLGHLPTPIDKLQRLGETLNHSRLYVKRDDCTGLAFGGNKIRQLEYYLGDAQSQGADTILITGAVQSNFVRSAAAAAAKLGMQCHVQLEHRVADVDATYEHSGNVLLNHMLGATLHYYPEGEDESGADRRVREIADQLQQQGRRTYVIPLSPGHPPLGALGYVAAAEELLTQLEAMNLAIDEIVVPSGSGHTHGGLLFGLRALGSNIQVTGVCVRRSKELQQPRILERCAEIATLLGATQVVKEADVVLEDRFLPPGYGHLNAATLDAIKIAAHTEALLLDPVYSGKAMACFVDHARHSGAERSLLMMHTGGTPAIFAYEPVLTKALNTGGL